MVKLSDYQWLELLVVFIERDLHDLFLIWTSMDALCADNKMK
jgi:hypothetical protein